MSKIKKFFKKPSQMWQRIFGFLPIISLGGTALILGTFALAPNFMNFAHAEESIAEPSANDTKLSMSVSGYFYSFPDAYIVDDAIESVQYRPITILPEVKTNNPAGYKIYFSDADEDTHMRSIDTGVTDSIRSIKDGEGYYDNIDDNIWLCGILRNPVNHNGVIDGSFTNGTGADLKIPTRSNPKLISERKLLPSTERDNGVYCEVKFGKKIAPSTYRDKLIFSTVANTKNLKPATLTSGYSAFRRIPANAANNRRHAYNSFKKGTPKIADLSEDILKDESIVASIKQNFSYEEDGNGLTDCPGDIGGFKMYNAATNDEEPVLIWTTNCNDRGVRWWTPSGKLSLGNNCARFFSSDNSPLFKRIDLSDIDISHCNNMESMFERTDRNSMLSINFGTTKLPDGLENIKKMFAGNTELNDIAFEQKVDWTRITVSVGAFTDTLEIEGFYLDPNEGCIKKVFNPSATGGEMAKTIGGYFHYVTQREKDEGRCVTVKPGKPSPAPGSPEADTSHLLTLRPAHSYNEDDNGDHI